MQVAVLRLVIATVSRHQQGGRRDLRSASCPARSLLIVGDAGRDVTAEDSLKVSDIDAHLHRRGAAEQVQLALPEFLLDVRSQVRTDRSRMLPGERGQRITGVSVHVVVRLSHQRPVGSIDFGQGADAAPSGTLVSDA
jgi:hypothetical protein